MLKLKLQYFGHPLWRACSLEKTLILGKIEGQRRRAWQRMRRLDYNTKSMDISLRKLWEMVKDREASGVTAHGVTESQRWLSHWTRAIHITIFLISQMVNTPSAMQETPVQCLGQEDSPGEGNGNLLQYSCLENTMDRGAWWAIVHGVTKSWTWLSYWHLKKLSSLQKQTQQMESVVILHSSEDHLRPG